MRIKRKGLQERFFGKVHKIEGGCWLFNGDPTKYGQLSSIEDGKRMTHLAHRLSYEIHVGPIPLGMFICHRCDVRGCVNPGHLYAGTHEDNKRDIVERGRAKVRRPSPHNATSAALREQIRKEYESGDFTQIDLAEKYGKTQGTISAIVNHYPRKKSTNGGKTRSGFFRRKMDPRLYDEIRSAYSAGGVTQMELAERYNCTQTHISRIVNKS